MKARTNKNQKVQMVFVVSSVQPTHTVVTTLLGARSMHSMETLYNGRESCTHWGLLHRIDNPT